MSNIMRASKSKEVKLLFIKDKNIITCMLLCLLIGCISFLSFIIADGGIFTLRDDFNTQQIPFATALNDSIKNYSGGWGWNIDLGTQLIGGYSFYNLGSPFFWITLLFGKGAVPYLVGPIYILKYMAAGVCSYLYIRMFVNDKKYAVIGALLYSFSGFQSANLLFYHFHDVVAFFPLLLLGLERLVRDNKKILFIFSIFLNCFLNYFFFIGEVLFIILYFIIKFYRKKEFITLVKNGLKCLGCGVIGVGMAAIILLPSILYVTGNPRSESSLYLQSLFYDTKNILMILKGFLFPGEAMHDQSAVFSSNWTSIACYLPLVGCSLPIAYVIKNKTNWLSKIILVLFAISFLPLIESAFYMYTAQIYKRWWYMLVLMLVLASSIALENRKYYPIKKGVIITIAGLGIFCTLLVCLKWSPQMEVLIFRKKVFVYNFLVSFLGLLLVLILLNRKHFVRIFTCFVAFFCALTTFSTIFLYRQNSKTGQAYLQEYNLGLALKNLDDQYRYNLTKNIFILPGEATGIGSFNSTVSNSIIEFYSLLDYKRAIFSPDPNDFLGLKELLAAKYNLAENADDKFKTADTISVGEKTYYVTEHEACPIGFSYDSYLLQDDVKRLDVKARGIALLDNLVISKEYEPYVKDYLVYNKRPEYSVTQSEVSKYTTLNTQNKVYDFTRNNSGFTCTTENDDSKVIFFTVPYDKGWSAFVNGKETRVINSSGMMSIVVPAGTCDIQLTYSTPGFKAGAAATAISFFLFIIMCIFEKKKDYKERTQIK